MKYTKALTDTTKKKLKKSLEAPNMHRHQTKQKI